MFRTASTGLVMAAGLAVLLATAEPAAAQKAKKGTRSSRPAASKVERVARPSARSRPTVRSPRVSKPSIRTARPSASSRAVTRIARPSNRVTTTPRINVARTDRARPQTNYSRAVQRALRPSGRVRGIIPKATPQERQSVDPGKTLRVNRVAEPSQRTRDPRVTAFRKAGNPDDRGVSRADAERVKDALRSVPDRRSRRDYTNDRPRRRPVYDGRRSGYHSGYRHGYHDGFHRRHFYQHRHYYGPHAVFGWHYGGFGFYSGHWHFAIVIGSPVLVHRHYHHYRYTWWDGYGASLVTWDRALEVRPANYAFTDGSCVELWLQTTNGTEYAVKADPRYWGARDPGELYAALWGELEREGQLQIEDINGAIHVFPAGMIQQIEARACR